MGNKETMVMQILVQDAQGVDQIGGKIAAFLPSGQIRGVADTLNGPPTGFKDVFGLVIGSLNDMDPAGPYTLRYWDPITLHCIIPY